MSGRLEGRLAKVEAKMPDQPDQYGFTEAQRAQIKVWIRQGAAIWCEYVKEAPPELFEEANANLALWADLEADLREFDHFRAVAYQAHPMNEFYQYSRVLGPEDALATAVRPVLQEFYKWTGEGFRNWILHIINIKFGVYSYANAVS